MAYRQSCARVDAGPGHHAHAHKGKTHKHKAHHSPGAGHG